MHRTAKAICIAVCFVLVAIAKGYAQEPFAITDPNFIDRSFKGTSDTDLVFRDDGKGVRGEGVVDVQGGRQIFWGHGSKHALQGRVVLFGYTFDSDAADLLQFRVDKDKGYVYVKGKGRVTLPSGQIVTLPVEKK